MRIVHAATFGLAREKGNNLHPAKKISLGLVRAGHHVIDLPLRDVARWAGLFGRQKLGAGAERQALVNTCRVHRPDVLVLGHAESILPENVEKIRTILPDIKVMQWNVDPIQPPDLSCQFEVSASHNIERIVRKNDVVDATFVTTAGPTLDHLASRMKGVVAFLPNAIDKSMERGRSFERVDQRYDVFFACAGVRHHAGHERDMDALFNELTASLPELSIDAHGVNGHPFVTGKAYEDVLEDCRIGLNISRRNDVYLYSSDRLAHMVGNGLAVCIDRATGYGDLFGEDEFVFYATEEELIAQLDRLGRDDALRRRVAERGYRRYGDLFDNTTVSRYMLDVLFDAHDPARYEWPTIAAGGRVTGQSCSRT